MYGSIYVGGVPVRGALILSPRHSEVGWPVPFLAAFNFPSAPTWYPFTAEWTVSEHPNYDPRVRLETSFAQQSSALTTCPFTHLPLLQSIKKRETSYQQRENWRFNQKMEVCREEMRDLECMC